MSIRYDTGEGNLRRWYDDPDYPVLYPVLRHLWPDLEEDVKTQIICDAAGGGDMPGAGLDYALYEAAHRGLLVPDELLGRLEAEPQRLFDQYSIPESVEVLRTMNRIAA